MFVDNLNVSVLGGRWVSIAPTRTFIDGKEIIPKTWRALHIRFFTNAGFFVQSVLLIYRYCSVEWKKSNLAVKQFSDKALQDFKLIDRAVQDGDEKAYAELMKRYKTPVYHMILKMIRNVDDAEDLTIEAFAKAFRNLHKFKK